jgi:starch phosphorylase
VVRFFNRLTRHFRTDIANKSNRTTYFAVRGSGRVNGFSQLHGQVSRRIFEPLFQRWPQEEIPIGSVTNGVHVPTWDSAAADVLWTTACGKKRWHEQRPVEDHIRQLSDAELWQMRTEERRSLIDHIRKRYARQLASESRNPSDANGVFDENVLTVGFARRFATYKRPKLLLHDPERLVRLLTDQSRPLQLILAGKAHPGDLALNRVCRVIARFGNLLKRGGRAEADLA